MKQVFSRKIFQSQTHCSERQPLLRKKKKKKKTSFAEIGAETAVAFTHRLLLVNTWLMYLAHLLSIPPGRIWTSAVCSWTSVSHEPIEGIDQNPSEVLTVWIIYSSRSSRSQHWSVSNLLSALNFLVQLPGQGHIPQQSALDTAPQLGASSYSQQSFKVSGLIKWTGKGWLWQTQRDLLLPPSPPPRARAKWNDSWKRTGSCH